MTTAEFIIGHSADDADERKQELRKVFWALLIAVAIHLLIGYSLAVYGGYLYAPFNVAEEDNPVELTFVNLPPVLPEATQQELRVTQLDKSKETANPPKEKNFQANINSVAASEQPAAGTEPIPTQDGKTRPWMSLDDEQYSDAMRGTNAPPSPRETKTEQSQPETIPSAPPKSEAEQFALLTSTPQPKTQPSVAPRTAQERQAARHKTKVMGNISNRGPASVNAIGTPFGRYSKTIYDAIGTRFQAYYQQKIDLVSLGSVELHFIIERSGKIRDLKVLKNTSNETLANICLQSVIDAQLPPIPEDLAQDLPPEGLEWEPTFTIFPN